MRAFFVALAASALLLIGAPMAEATPNDDFAAIDDAVGTQICHLLDTGMSGPQIYAQLQKDWTRFDKILVDMGQPAPDRRAFVKQAVATKCPGHSSKVAGL